ncbi:hypothetical protein F5Y12DRAFT_777738 [Xylaria sp. FL1777]|nr:hypothetical protein F5Y12DRAFT_777738 [Xylaria sp. FL1777]
MALKATLTLAIAATAGHVNAQFSPPSRDCTFNAYTSSDVIQWLKPFHTTPTAGLVLWSRTPSRARNATPSRLRGSPTTNAGGLASSVFLKHTQSPEQDATPSRLTPRVLFTLFKLNFRQGIYGEDSYG